MSNRNNNTNPKIEIKLQKNIQLSFNSGFGSLIIVNSDECYRNAIISIHNGLELLMKYYLEEKNKLLIFENINRHFLLNGMEDLRKKLNYNKAKPYTISFNVCTEIMGYFTELPEQNKKYLTQLNNLRNDCVHYQYSYIDKDLRKLLIFHIYQFICDIILEMGLELNEFILDEHVAHLDKFKETIDDEIRHSYYIIIIPAIKHYYSELTEDERKQKAQTEDYTKKRYDEIVKCPACNNKALLRKKIQYTIEQLVNHEVIKRDII